LNIEDFRSNERTFGILVQVAGRAGRENQQGKVIIQTYNPENFCIEHAKEQDYDSFFNTEIAIRKSLNYPPFCDIIMFGISGADEEEVIKASKKLHNILKKNNKEVNMFPPVPAPIGRIKNKYRWRIIVKCKLNNSTVDWINNALEEYYKLKYKNVTVVADANPSNLS